MGRQSSAATSRSDRPAGVGAGSGPSEGGTGLAAAGVALTDTRRRFAEKVLGTDADAAAAEAPRHGAGATVIELF